MIIPIVSLLQNVLVCLLILITFSKASAVCPVKPGISFYPDPADCQAYTYCLRGVLHPGSCTGTLYFNSVTNKCDVRANVHCPPGSKPYGAVAAAKPKPPALTTPKPTTTTSTLKPTTTTSTPEPTTTTTEPTTTPSVPKASCNCNTSGNTILIPSPPSNGNSPAENPTPIPSPPETTTQSPESGNPISDPPPPPPPLPSPPIMSPQPPPPMSPPPPEPMSPPPPPPMSPPPETTDSNPPENPPTGVTSNPMESTTAINIETTPAEVTKPPITVRSLPGKYPHEFSCKDEPCGIYPNINDCSQYILCSEGKETVKHCNDGQLFDTRTLECQNAEKAQCWQEPACESSRQRPEPRRPCPFHNKTAMPYVPTDNVILASPMVTNWGNWEGWKYCPPNTYVNGIYVWRQLVQTGPIIDQAGIASISLNCATINGDLVTNIESHAPGAPAETWPTHYTCVGTGIGFRANSQPDQGSGDDLATDNIQVLCSCGPPVYKRYDLQTGIQSGDRGAWTEPQVCLPKQAVCGMQTQMVPFTQDGSNDNTGLNNLQMKCCDVPDPTDSCIPTEEMRLLRKCSNLEGKFHRRLDFPISIGLAYDTSVHYNTLNFYGSIGYALNDTRDVLMTKFADLAEKNLSVTHEYHWDSPHESVLENEKTTERFIYVNVNTTTELYQIVGKCSPYEIRTNWLVQIDTDVNTGAVEKTYYEI